MNDSYALVIQGETTLVSMRLLRHQKLREYGDISVSWGIPQCTDKKTEVTCLFFCEFTLQIMLPMIKIGSLSKECVSSLANHVANRVKTIADLYGHVYVFDFVSCIDWQHQGYANATSTLGEYQLKLLANATLADALSDEPQITVIPQSFFWGESIPKVSKEYFARTNAIFSVADSDRFVSHVSEFLADQARLRIKCICLDLDDTIWGGTAGELDEPALLDLGGISAEGRGYQLVQYILRELKLSGIYLAVVSKNSMEVVKHFFDESPDMILTTADIACFELGFSNKSQRIERIARRLNIGLDAVMFLDDNPTERGLVKAKLPQVTVLDFDSSPTKFADILSRSPAIRAPFLVDEDYGRCESAGIKKFECSDEEGILDLPTEIKVESISASYSPRLFQLINKTNQFTSAGMRISRPQLARYFETESLFIFAAFAKDEFSDLGLVGIIFGDESEQVVTIRGLVLSCRAFGRNIEYKMVDTVLEKVGSGAEIRVQYRATDRNQLAVNFIRKLPSLDPRIVLEAYVDD